jgi:hypothetical protein
MTKLLKKLGMVFCLLLLAGAAVSCGSASGPSAPAEIPVPLVLKFVSYQGLSINLDNISTGSSLPGQDLNPAVKALNAGDPIKDAIVVGPNIYNSFHDNFFVPTLQGIEEIKIPAESTRHKYSALVDFSSATGILQGQNVRVDLNFLDFDLDGDGMKEGCSGNTLTPPICARLWVAGRRFLAGVFLKPPVYSTNPSVPDDIGKGTFKALVDNLDGSSMALTYRYDQSVSDDGKKEVLSVEFFSRVTPSTSYHGEPKPPLDIQLWDLHAALLQTTPILPDDPSITPLERAPLKRFNERTTYDGSFIFENFRVSDDLIIDRYVAPLNFDVSYLGQYVQDGGFWSGSYDTFIDLQGNTKAQAEFGICATLPDGIVLIPGTECQDVGGRDIRVDGDPFVPPLADANVAFPSLIIFPATPPLF